MREASPERSKQLVNQLARRIGRWRLTLPSLMFLELAKPLSFIASQGLLLCQPFLGFFELEEQVADYADLLGDRSNIDHLIARLEQDLATHRSSGKEGD